MSSFTLVQRKQNKKFKQVKEIKHVKEPKQVSKELKNYPKVTEIDFDRINNYVYIKDFNKLKSYRYKLENLKNAYNFETPLNYKEKIIFEKYFEEKLVKTLETNQDICNNLKEKYFKFSRLEEDKSLEKNMSDLLLKYICRIIRYYFDNYTCDIIDIPKYQKNDEKFHYELMECITSVLNDIGFEYNFQELTYFIVCRSMFQLAKSNRKEHFIILKDFLLRNKVCNLTSMNNFVADKYNILFTATYNLGSDILIILANMGANFTERNKWNENLFEAIEKQKERYMSDKRNDSESIEKFNTKYIKCKEYLEKAYIAFFQNKIDEQESYFEKKLELEKIKDEYPNIYLEICIKYSNLDETKSKEDDFISLDDFLS